MEPQRDRDEYWRSLSESINKIAEDYRLSSAELAQSAITFHRAAQQLLELRKKSSNPPRSPEVIVRRVPRKFRG